MPGQKRPWALPLSIRTMRMRTSPRKAQLSPPLLLETSCVASLYSEIINFYDNYQYDGLSLCNFFVVIVIALEDYFVQTIVPMDDVGFEFQGLLQGKLFIFTKGVLRFVG